MPATFAHPVFAVPFRRFGLPTAALSLGAMVPDLAYVFGIGGYYFGHTRRGLFLFALPVGLLLWVVFHQLVKPAVMDAVPRPWRVRLEQSDAPVHYRAVRTWVRAVLAVTVGAFTHIAVDEFTHRYGWGPRLWPDIFVATQYMTPIGPLPLYKILQYGGGTIGTVVLAVWVAQWYRRQPGPRFEADDRRRLGHILVGLAGVGLVAMGRAGWVAAVDTRGSPMHVFLVQTAAGGLVLMTLALLLAGVVHRVRQVI